MKSFIKILCGLSILGLATVACNKEVETETPVASKHSVKVTAGISAETRTEMLPSGNQTKWTEEDVSNIHFFENGIEPPEGDLLVDLNDEKTVMTLMADFPTPSVTPSKYVYTSILASDLDENKNAILDDEQIFFNGTFDPTADILVAKPEEFPANQNEVVFSMQYKRVVAVNKIKIKGLEADDNVISVTINANKPILGSYSMTNDAWTNSGYELVLYPYNDLEVSSNGEVSIYFITAPVENALLSIYVETENHNYEKDFTKPITFAANTVTSFATTVAGSEINEHEGTNDFIRVESASVLEEGDYLLVTEKTGNMFNGISSTSTKYGTGESVTISDHVIDDEDVDEDNIIHIAPATNESGNYILHYSGKLLFGTGGNTLNVTTTENDAARWSISCDASGNAAIYNVSYNTRRIVWNARSGQARFAAYANPSIDDNGNEYHNVQLFKKDVSSSTKIAFAKPVISLERNATLDGIIVTWNDVSKAANYTVTCTGQTSQTIAQGVQTAEFKNLAPGTYAVTVTANPANVERNTASVSDEASLEIIDYQLVAPTLSFTPAVDNIVVSWAAVPNAVSYTYTVLGPDDAVVIAETNTEALTFTASNLAENTTYTFKIKSIGETPYISSDFATQTQKTLKSALASIAEIMAELANNAETFEANLTNAIITGTYTGSNSTVYAYIQDASAGILIMGATGLAKGDSFTGYVSGTITTYKDQPEITSIDVSQATKMTGAAIPEPVVVTINQLNTSMATYDGRLCKIAKANAASTLATGTNKSINIAQGENTIKLFTRISYEANSVVKDTYYDVIGYPVTYDGVNEIVVIETGKITETAITWQLKSIGVATQPSKRNYTVGEYFDPTGLVISTVVEDASDNTIFKDGENVPYEDNESDFSFNPGLSDALTTDNTSVTISYGGKTATQAITVTPDGGGIAPVNGTCFNLTSYNNKPDGWTFTNVETGSYFKVNTGGSMVSPAYDLTGCATANVSIKVAKYGSGTNPAAVLSVSYDGGNTWTESKTLTAPTNSTYLQAQTLELSKTFTKKVVIKLENPTGNAALRVQNFSFTVTE